MRTAIIILLSTLFLTACEEHFLTKLPAPESNPQIFVHCVLGAGDSSIKAELYWTKPYYGPLDYTSDFDPVNNATVKITGQGQTVTLAYDPAERAYLAWNTMGFLVEGGAYTLSIEHPTEELIIARTVIPGLHISEFDVQYDSVIIDPDFGDSELQFKTRFRDRKGSADYYQISGFYALYSTQPFGEEMIFDPRFFMISDKDRDGVVLEQISSGYYYPQIDTLFFTIHIQAVSRDLYLYRQSINPYLGYGVSPDGGFVEPTIVHSNIEGGVGIFGAAMLQTYEMYR